MILAVILSCAGVAQAASPILTTIHNFSGSPNDGAAPLGMVMDTNGVLYGVADSGGSTAQCRIGCGAVFSLVPPTSGGAWTETVYLFPGGSSGASPYGVTGQGTVLYGTTLQGGNQNGGTVFSLKGPAGMATERVIAGLGGDNGLYPEVAPIMDSHGVLYATSVSGGTYGYGAVFSLTPPASPGGAWTETVLHSFNYPDGINPYAGVVIDSAGVLYGTTLAGGPNDAGIVYSLTPPAVPGGAWTETVLHNFTGGGDGGSPRNGNLAIGAGGVLYGTTPNGGATSSAGTVFSLTPPATPGGAWIETVLHTFQAADGSTPEAGVIISSTGTLFGTTYFGGKYNHGTVFALTPPATPGGAWKDTILYSFTGGNDGSGPWANVLIGRGGVLYGTTLAGGTSGNGTVFSLAITAP